jgi:hypothetical protein
MRRRGYGEPEQDLLTLLIGIDATTPEDVNPLAAHNRAVRQLQHQDEPEEPDTEVSYVAGAGGDEDFDVASDVVPDIEDSDRLVISADKEFCLPGRASVTATRAILAKKGSGKTYLAMVIAEEFLRFSPQLPFVVIDPTGVWYGLSSTHDGQPSPFPVMVLGGANGDVGLGKLDGRKAAEIVIAKWPCPIVLDVSEMYPEDQHLFVADFGDALYAKNRKSLHIFVDEADEFAPQRMDSTYRHQKKCFQVIDRLVRRGRNRGIGLTAITQRPAVLHKNILTQVDGLIVMHLVAPHDLQAVETWMQPIMDKSASETCLSALPKLRPGEGFFMQSGSEVVPCLRFITRPKTTFDSSKTPNVDDPNPFMPSLGHVPLDILKYASAVLRPQPGDQQQEQDSPEDSFSNDDSEDR